MNIREEILAAHSLSQSLKISNWIGKSKLRFKILMDLFLNDEYRVVQRSAHAVCLCILNNPDFLKDSVSLLLNNLDKDGLHPAVKRNTMRVFENLMVPEPYHDRLINFCFNYLSDPVESVATKGYSLTILQKYCKLYPELKNEMKVIIQQIPIKNASFQVRLRSFLNEPER